MLVLVLVLRRQSLLWCPQTPHLRTGLQAGLTPLLELRTGRDFRSGSQAPSLLVPWQRGLLRALLLQCCECVLKAALHGAQFALTALLENGAFGHGEKSVFIINQYMRITPEEAMAINWHMGAFDSRVLGGSYAVSDAFYKYKLSLLMHIADLTATYIDEERG